MRLIVKGLACAGLLWGLSTPGHAVRGVAPPPDGSLDRELGEYQKLSLIFGAIEPVSVAGKRWVAVEVGPAGSRHEVRGWLLEDGPTAIRLHDENGDSHSLRKPQPGERRPAPKEGEKLSPEELFSEKYRAAWRVRPRDYKDVRTAFLKRGIPPEKEEPEGVRGAYRFVYRRVELEEVVVGACRHAHWAAQRGEKRLVLDLYALAKGAHAAYTMTYVAEKPAELHGFVAEKIGSGYRSAAISAAHAGGPRTEALQRWERIARIPFHKHVAEAREMVAGYRSLIAEDRAWKEPDARALAKRTPEEKAAYWMYHLRDADASQWSNPGMCHVLLDEPLVLLGGEKEKKKPNPAVELEKLGVAAVPLLIAHLDDARPTRCQGSDYLLRYGDYCQQILESITGRSLHDPTSTSDYPLRDGKGKECKARAQRWWRDYQRKGEQRMLIEGTETGDHDSPEQGKRLATRYPRAALGPLLKGARRSKDSSVRANLVRMAAQFEDEGVTAFLREEVRGPHFAARVVAARALAERGEKAGVQALIRECKAARGQEERAFEDWWALDELISCLLRCGDPAAIAALAADFQERPLWWRSKIVHACGRLERDLRGRPLSQAAQDAVDDLLALALADETVVLMSRGSPKGKVSDPLLGDLAAEALAERWKQPGLFDISRPLGERQRQRLAVKNAWLKKRGRPAVAVPAPPRVEPAPEGKVRPLLEAVRGAKTAEARRAPLEALEKLGLPALPAVRREVRALASSHPAYGELESLSRRLAWTVSEVHFTEDSVRAGEALARAVEALRGKPITDRALLDVLRLAVRSLPPGARGVQLILERPGDDTGASLLLTLVADRPPRKRLAPQLDIRKTVLLDREEILGGLQVMAGIGQKVELSEIDWKDLEKALQKAFRAGPERYVLVRAGCEERR